MAVIHNGVLGINVPKSVEVGIAFAPVLAPIPHRAIQEKIARDWDLTWTQKNAILVIAQVYQISYIIVISSP